jgi:hypothetical protein
LVSYSSFSCPFLRRLTFLSLEPAQNERVIGFYGTNEWGQGFSGILQFGIITAPKDVELPMQIYDLAELKNTDGGHGDVS